MLVQMLLIFTIAFVVPLFSTVVYESLIAWISHYNAIIIRPMIFDNSPTSLSTSSWFHSIYTVTYSRDYSWSGFPYDFVYTSISPWANNSWRSIKFLEVYLVACAGGILAMLLWSKWLERRSGLHDTDGFTVGQQWPLLDRFSRTVFPVAYGLIPIWFFAWVAHGCISWCMLTVLPYDSLVGRYMYLLSEPLNTFSKRFEFLLQYAPLVLLAWVFAHAPAVVRMQLDRRLAANPLLCRCGYTTVNGKCPECGKPWRWIRRTGRLPLFRATRLRRLRRRARRGFVPLVVLMVLFDCTYGIQPVMQAAAWLGIVNGVGVNSSQAWAPQSGFSILHTEPGRDVVLTLGAERFLLRVVPGPHASVEDFSHFAVAVPESATDTSCVVTNTFRDSRVVTESKDDVVLTLPGDIKIYILPGMEDRLTGRLFVRCWVDAPQRIPITRRIKGDASLDRASSIADEIVARQSHR